VSRMDTKPPGSVGSALGSGDEDTSTLGIFGGATAATVDDDFAGRADGSGEADGDDFVGVGFARDAGFVGGVTSGAGVDVGFSGGVEVSVVAVDSPGRGRF